MEIMWILIAAVILLGTFNVLVPLVLHNFTRNRKKRVLRRPETGILVEVDLDAQLAACSSPLGMPLLRVKNCTLWPKRRRCNMECLANVT